MEYFVLIIVNIAVWVGLYLIFNNRIKKALGAQELLKEVRDEVDGLMKDLNQVSDRNIAILESRIGRMEELLKQADTRLLLWARETEKLTLTKATYSELKKIAPIVRGEAEAIPQKIVETQENKPEVTVPQSIDPLPIQELEKTYAVDAESLMDTKDRVLFLKAKGISSLDIATEVNLSLGEVELILSLYFQTSQ